MDGRRRRSVALGARRPRSPGRLRSRDRRPPTRPPWRPPHSRHGHDLSLSTVAGEATRIADPPINRRLLGALGAGLDVAARCDRRRDDRDHDAAEVGPPCQPARHRGRAGGDRVVRSRRRPDGSAAAVARGVTAPGAVAHLVWVQRRDGAARAGARPARGRRIDRLDAARSEPRRAAPDAVARAGRRHGCRNDRCGATRSPARLRRRGQRVPRRATQSGGVGGGGGGRGDHHRPAGRGRCRRRSAKGGRRCRPRLHPRCRRRARVVRRRRHDRTVRAGRTVGGGGVDHRRTAAAGSRSVGARYRALALRRGRQRRSADRHVRRCRRARRPVRGSRTARRHGPPGAAAAVGARVHRGRIPVHRCRRRRRR